MYVIEGAFTLSQQFFRGENNNINYCTKSEN